MNSAQQLSPRPLCGCASHALHFNTHSLAIRHEEGLVYRAERLVNWSPHLQTALSDIEVEHVDVAPNTLLSIPSEPEKCALHHAPTAAHGSSQG